MDALDSSRGVRWARKEMNEHLQVLLTLSAFEIATSSSVSVYLLSEYSATFSSSSIACLFDIYVVVKIMKSEPVCCSVLDYPTFKLYKFG